MLNPFKEVNWNPDTAARRKFAVSLMVGFPAIALVSLLTGWLRTGHWPTGFALSLGGLGAAAGVVFYAVPAISRPFYVVWYAFACCIGLVMGNIVLGLIFFLLVTGIGLVKRLGRKQPIRKTCDRASATYWIDAPPAPNPQRYFSQF